MDRPRSSWNQEDFESVEGIIQHKTTAFQLDVLVEIVTVTNTLPASLQMSGSDDGSSARLQYSSYSRPASKAHSVGYLSLTNLKPTRTAILNILFLGETSLGESSIVDLIAGTAERPLHPKNHNALCDDARTVTLDGKIFILHTLPSPTSEYVSAAALKEGVESTLTNIRKNGGVHLLVYCMHALHPTSWVHRIHRTIASYSTLSPHTSVVAVVAGISDVGHQDSWWTSNEDALTKQGPRFDDHAFIRMMATGARSPTGDDISESRRVLHALILQNCTYSLGSDANLNFQYKQRPIENSFQSFFHMITRKPSSNFVPTSSKAIDVVLLGEIGVGKSTLVNLIARENVAGVSSDTIACTRTVAKYTFEEKGRTFHLYDTPGLVDPQMGVKAFVDPVDTIHKLIRSLGNGNGPDLFLFCIDDSKPTAALRRNYRLFCRIICGGKVPFALAITKIEGDQDSDQWWSQHGATIREYGIDCIGHVGLGREKNRADPTVHLGGRSRESLLSFLVACPDLQKNKTGSLRWSMGRMVGSLTTVLRSSTLERTLMNQCGLEEQTARELVNRLVASEQSYK